MGEIGIQTFEATGIVAQQVYQSGEYVAGRDILITENTYTMSDLRFIEINQEPYKPGRYIAPKFSSEVLNILKSRKLAIVGGNYEFDKNSFIRHLAVQLSEDTTIQRVREWADQAKNYSLYSVLVGEKESTIFIFSQITPQDIKYNLDKFVNMAVEHGHYIIMSTDLPLEVWQLPNSLVQSHWFHTPSSDLYDSETLTLVLVNELQAKSELITLEHPIRELNGESILAADLTVRNIANQLETIDRIKVFVRSLTVEKRPLSKNIVLDLIKLDTKDKQDLIRQWFNTLNEKEKESLIAMSIFDGLYDDQFFSAVEKLVQESWKNRDCKLIGIDYHDLDTLLNFFNLEEIDEKLRLIRSRFSNQRLEFFKSIWFSHRRQILSTFPMMVKLIKDSVYRPHSNWDLFGTHERSARLQEVISLVISDIGIIHFPVVENVFLQLASDKSIEVQQVTANSLARWRKFGLEEQLFEVLDKWQSESRIREIIQELVNASEEASQTPSEAFIRSTIALTLGYAAEYDKPNELSGRLVNLFKEFADDQNPFVRERIRQFTIPRLASNHLTQLKSHLFDLAIHNDFIYPIALGIAKAYMDYPEQTETLIHNWLEYCRINTNKRSTQFNTTHRDKVLITIILALSQIEFIESYKFNADNAYNIICKLQTEEYHIPVKKYYLKFIINQIDVHASRISTQILQVIENLSLKDRPELISYFVKIYLEQRSLLPDGEAEVYFRKKQIPIWIDGIRPKTEIEKTMQEWLISENTTGQQIAIDSLYEFTKVLEVPESDYIKIVKERREKGSEVTTTTPVYAPDERITNFEPNFTARVIAWFTLDHYAPESRKILKNLLPVLIRKELNQSRNLNLIANKFENENTQLQGVSAYLKKLPNFISNYSTSKVIVIAILILWLIAIIL